MKYIIMCGGTFPRFSKPRHMTLYRGEPLVARTIRLLRENNVSDIGISSNNSGFEQFGVPVLRHENTYTSWAYDQCTGLWCEAFYPTNEPTCYVFGDVCFSPQSIRKIVETETDDIMLFASAPPFPPEYPKGYIEPFAFKVVNTDHLKKAVADVKRLAAAGRFRRKPIAWEVWNVISRGPDGDVNWIDYGSYVHINDWTTDVDYPHEVNLIRKLAEIHG